MKMLLLDIQYYRLEVRKRILMTGVDIKGSEIVCWVGSINQCTTSCMGALSAKHGIRFHTILINLKIHYSFRGKNDNTKQYGIRWCTN